ncbi:hypothetical protein GGS21DRAFT_529123, partial [Xylaria nigripes]
MYVCIYVLRIRILVCSAVLWIHQMVWLLILRRWVYQIIYPTSIIYLPNYLPNLRDYCKYLVPSALGISLRVSDLRLAVLRCRWID